MTDNETTKFNKKIIQEFRKNHGIVGEPFSGIPLLLLATTGAKSGKSRLNPLAYSEEGDDIVVIASMAGAEQNPPWFYNLKAYPNVEVEVGDEKFQAIAQITDEPLRTDLYKKMEEKMPMFSQDREKTKRVIPVILLKKVNSSTN